MFLYQPYLGNCIYHKYITYIALIFVVAYVNYQMHCRPTLIVPIWHGFYFYIKF